MSYRYYFSPIIHCPSLCPYHPPKGLFLDDYDPDREEIAWKFCTEHCWLASESERACMIEHARLRAEARKLEPTSPRLTSRAARVSGPPVH